MLKPSALILLAVILVPLIGVTAWGWDAFVLLMLYWLETAVIAFWTIVRIGLMTPETLGDMKLGGKEGVVRGLPFGIYEVANWNGGCCLCNWTQISIPAAGDVLLTFPDDPYSR